MKITLPENTKPRIEMLPLIDVVFLLGKSGVNFDYLYPSSNDVIKNYNSYFQDNT